ncbi:MAG: N4-gp56 family major capsid protein [Candidatus Omnitrophica bacterium]|nr:N4-gp56 family major capsid protein [Candidatus Omnitrophota bacterium]
MARKVWAKDAFIEGKTESYFYGQGLVGQGPNNIVMERPELEGNQGDTVHVFQIREISGAGVANDGMMEGAEVAPNVYDDAIVLTQIRQAIRTAGRESEMRSLLDMRKWMKELLARWYGAYIDQLIFTAVEGSATKTIYGGDATTTGTLEAGDYMTLSLISKCVTYAKKATPLVVGPTYKGKQVPGIIVISPDQAADLMERDASWNQSRMEAAIRGNDNPIFTGALGAHRNVPIHEHSRCATSTTWGSGAVNGAQASFMGCQAAAIAYSKKKIWEEKTFDYQNKTGFCIGAILGVTKLVMNSNDIGYIAVDTMRSNN